MGMVPNGLLPNASAGVTRRLDPERWAVAEGRTAELIARIQPNAHSEGRRLAVYHYVQRLIMNCLSCQVFTFGSVPLKTYLPDGDIDVTAFGNSEELKDIWANLVRDALEREEKSENAEFHVKEVQYIQAEVKIIKCIVENIVVDISFNQVGGLCTLCFLEEIDNLISRNHLFKRSIILIKAWCFYESRILGAHHGLISTYALEMLVLYIFHVFNNSFTGPLEVLYRFLEFFSNFDWEKFCLSLWGPVPISSLPDMTAEPPRMDSGELLLNKSFLDTCSAAYGVVPRTQENKGPPFVSKHFNIIDPLRTNNNLGRSVSKGNLFRIRSAFAYGAKRLGKLLECPKENLVIELNQFFTNTWIRYGSGSRPDVPTQSLVDVQPLKVVPSVVSNSYKSVTACKKKVESPKLLANQDNLHADQENLTEVGHRYPDRSSQSIQKSDLNCHTLPATVNPSISHAQHQKVYAAQGNARVSEQLERKPTEADDGPRNMTLVPIINEASEIVTGPDSFPTQSRTKQVANDVDPTQTGMPNPVFAPFVIGSPQQRQADSSGSPTGPPVPFVVLPYAPGNSDGCGPQFERSEAIDQLSASIAGQNFSLLNDVDQPDSCATSTASCSTMTEPSREHKPDILSGDFISHWHNLQYGRLCQNTRPLGPVLYPFPVPQMYLQGHAAWDGPARRPAANVNWTQMVAPGQRLFPVIPLQQSTQRGTGVLHNYGEDAPRYRGGTGTYFPNPVPFRDRHSNSRNYRGGYNGDRSDYSDKEGGWINSKQRNPNRSYGRSQSERSGMRSDRQANDESQPDRPRRTYRNDSYRHEASSQYLVQGQSFGSTSSTHKQGNIAHEVYTPQSTASNGAGALSGPPGPPFFMVYSYEPGTNHGASSSEPIEFGSLGPLPAADGDDIPRSTHQVMPNGFHGQRRGPYRGGSSHSSPDQPSSPQPRR
ncbi:uncharacterized protein LOC112875606 isoform X2 [Panicum hallii]|uniref:uncharacterized protein LOC112875606 isoform X2 n=1 Tax=Panicum hallii TaxID=206008 RepID=UPI000DF4D8D5|nr:uncharacterized protein LOC112875606 isoform X2 [Panicum hallii]